MANDFLDEDINFPHEDYSWALDIFNRAIKEGNTDRLILSENELVFVIDSYMDSDELDNALTACEPVYSRYDSDILFRYIDLLIILKMGNEALYLLKENSATLLLFPEKNLLYAGAYLCIGKFKEARDAVSEFETKDFLNLI